jgi:hypothetical protein
MFSKMIRVVPVKKAISAPELARLLIRDLYSRFGLPEVFVSDRDPRFTGNFWQSVFRQLGTKLHMSTAFHPESDGQTERANRTLLEMLRGFVGPHQSDWDRKLPILEFAYNNSVHPSTGHTPFFLNYGRHPRTALSLSISKHAIYPAVTEWLRELEVARVDASRHLDRAQEVQSKALSAKRKEHLFNVGDSVLLDSRNLNLPANRVRKLSARYIGPFSVIKVINRNAYKLDLPKSFGRIHPVFNIGLLKPYVPDPFSRGSRPLPIQVDGHDEYVVDQILSESKGRGPKRYLVLWEGYPSEEATWVSRAMVEDCAAFDAYLARSQ